MCSKVLQWSLKGEDREKWLKLGLLIQRAQINHSETVPASHPSSYLPTKHALSRKGDVMFHVGTCPPGQFEYHKPSTPNTYCVMNINRTLTINMWMMAMKEIRTLHSCCLVFTEVWLENWELGQHDSLILIKLFSEL